MMTAFAIVPCPSHSFPNLMALVAPSAFAPKASKVARTANRSRNMAILWLAKRYKNITAAPDLAMMCADFAVFTAITNCTGLPCEESFVLRLGFYFCGAQMAFVSNFAVLFLLVFQAWATQRERTAAQVRPRTDSPHLRA